VACSILCLRKSTLSGMDKRQRKIGRGGRQRDCCVWTAVLCFPFDMTSASPIPPSLDDPPHFPRKQRVVLEGAMGQSVVRIMNSGSVKSTTSHSECCMILHPREKALPISSVGNIVAPSIGALVPLTSTPQQVELMSKRYGKSSKPSILTSTYFDTASSV